MSSPETYKNIFIQKTIVKTYLPGIIYNDLNYATGKNEIFPALEETEEYRIIFTHESSDIDLLVEKGNKFFINSLNKVITIDSIFSSSDNETVYLIKETEIIYNENSKNIWDNLVNEFKAEIDKIATLEEEYQEKIKNIEQTYQYRFELLKSSENNELNRFLKKFIEEFLFKGSIRRKIYRISGEEKIKVDI